MMHPSHVTTIAVDAMGGDFAPGAVLEGVEAALTADPSLRVLLVGSADTVEPFAAAHEHCEPVATTQIIEMGEHPAAAVRSKTDSSIVVGCRLVKEGRADGFFSAGSTGAVMAAATLVIGRIKGVQRPAFATVLPTAGAPCVLLDVGANADCKPEYLAQFAKMGASYATAALGIREPRIGLLNIGEEPGKGSQLAQDAYDLLSGTTGFAGNIEGRDIPAGTVDVVVTDGFTGNVVLKTAEGAASVITKLLKEELMASPLRKLGALFLRGAFRSLARRLDYAEHGGAPLLGVEGNVVLCHGGSNEKAIKNAIRMAARLSGAGLVDAVKSALESSAGLFTAAAVSA